MTWILKKQDRLSIDGYSATLNETAKQVYDRLLTELIDWTLEPGDILVESRLAERFDTSRTPVREALKVLVGEGFLKAIPRTGYVVRTVTLEDVREVCYMREILEPEATALTAERVTDADVRTTIDELEACTQDLEAHSLQHGEDAVEARELYDYNTYFHLSIAHMSGISRLVTAISRLLKEEERVMFHDTTVKAPLFVAREHLELLDVIRTGDPEGARVAMRQHVQGNQDRLIDSLISRGNEIQVSISPRQRERFR